MNLYQVFNGMGEIEALYNVTNKKLSDSDVEECLREANCFEDEEEAEIFLEEMGIERVFVTEIYI